MTVRVTRTQHHPSIEPDQHEHPDGSYVATLPTAHGIVLHVVNAGPETAVAVYAPGEWARAEVIPPEPESTVQDREPMVGRPNISGWLAEPADSLRERWEGVADSFWHAVPGHGQPERHELLVELLELVYAEGQTAERERVDRRSRVNVLTELAARRYVSEHFTVASRAIRANAEVPAAVRDLASEHLATVADAYLRGPGDDLLPASLVDVRSVTVLGVHEGGNPMPLLDEQLTDETGQTWVVRHRRPIAGGQYELTLAQVQA